MQQYLTRTEALLALAEGKTVRSRTMLIRMGEKGFETRFPSTSWSSSAIELDHDSYVIVENVVDNL